MTYNPWQHLRERPDITFGVTTLPWGRGWWLRDLMGIVLDDRLTRVERKCVLAHELVHAELLDEQCVHDSCDGARLARRRERHADREAAFRLIDIRPLGEALAAHPDDLYLAADELDVDHQTLSTRLRHLHPAERHYLGRRLNAITGEEEECAK